ncbi:MAG: outer membrane lipid asymmetry maintenance protein MlaD, partial [Rhodobacterales bacterium]|nr:outer membrane lipid asymmetry maintenance protein MlaD [Rhodobacterales bacterium]
MAENPSEVIVGGAVLAAALGFLVFIGQATGFGTGRGGTYPLTASFRAVDGITVGSDVRLAGVKVGTITALELNPQTFYADATIAVREDIQLPEDSAILISSEGLLGGNYVEIVPGGALDVLPAGAKIEDTQGSVSLVTLLMKFVSAQADGGGA